MTYPIVLAHGVCRFDAIWQNALHIDNNDSPDIDMLHYFKGVRTMLKRNGFEVWHSAVPWGASVTIRAEALRKNILDILEKSGTAEKVHIIAHSMGGLDARHMMFQDRNEGRIHERVASLTTISTPHHGSPFADWAMEHMSEVLHAARAIGLDFNAVPDLTTESCRFFNENPEVETFEKELAKTVRLRTYAGYQDWRHTFWPLKISHKIIGDREGDNDGLVSVSSAAWHSDVPHKILPELDHLNELGWWDVSQIGNNESPAVLLKRVHDMYLAIAGEICNESRIRGV